MEHLSGKEILQVSTYEGLLQFAENNLPAVLHGAVHNIRDMGDFAFLIIRIPEGLVQCVFEKTPEKQDIFGALEFECTVEITGTARIEERAPAELRLFRKA